MSAIEARQFVQHASDACNATGRDRTETWHAAPAARARPQIGPHRGPSCGARNRPYGPGPEPRS